MTATGTLSRQPVRRDRTNSRSGLVVVLALTVAAVAACSDSNAAGGPTTRTTAGASPSSSPTEDPLTSCIEQLVYWAGENLRRAPDQGYDYQHMGLTSDKYDELRKIQTAARALKVKGKLPATFVHDRSRAACIRILATPSPTNTAGGWPQ